LKRKRDNPGPDHKPTFQTTQIDGVLIMQSPHVKFLEDNILTELYRPEWIGVFGEGESIEHLYTVAAPTGGERKEWYFHEHTIDRYMLLSGKVEMGLYDSREDSPTYGVFEVIHLVEPGGEGPNALRIPPLVWHSFKWASEHGLFLNAKLPGYNAEYPDKFRVQMEDLPDAILWKH
jgi:dTDP-4-dehydrorhamnose 3,5-epimerase